MRDYNEHYTKPPELLHFFQEKNRLLEQRKHVGRYTHKLKKRRKNLITFSVVSAIIGLFNFIMFLPLLLFVPLIFLTNSSYKKSNAELESLNQTLSDLGIAYKEEYKKLYRSNNQYHDNMYDTNSHYTNYNTIQNDDENHCNNNCENDCDCRDFTNGYNDNFDSDLDFDDYGGWGDTDDNGDYGDGGGFGDFDFGGDDGGDCDGGDD